MVFNILDTCKDLEILSGDSGHFVPVIGNMVYQPGRNCTWRLEPTVMSSNSQNHSSMGFYISEYQVIASESSLTIYENIPGKPPAQLQKLTGKGMY